MTAANDHREPLDADERDLAALLARIGPSDEPSPALDARILAAAHAAATTRAAGTRRRWLAWIGVPPALVTGAGLAAAAALALGLVWQLRPRTGVLPSYEAVGAGEELFVLAEPVARAPAANPPSFPAPSPPPAPSAAAVGPVKARAAASAESAMPVAAAPAAARAMPKVAQEPGTPAAAAPQAPEIKEAAALAAPAEAATGEETGFVPAPPQGPSVPAHREGRANHAPAAQAASHPRESALSAAPAPEARIADRENDAPPLERLDVTHTRHADVAADRARPWSELPVRDDARLEPGEWLARIRVRRDAGDLDGARASLRLLRREHPHVRVPDDLLALLGDAGP